MILARNLMNHAEVAPDRQERVPSKAMIIASSASDRTVERGSDGAVFISSTVARLRHFATVLGLMPSCAAIDPLINPLSLGPQAQLRERSLRSARIARTACVVVALP